MLKPQDIVILLKMISIMSSSKGESSEALSQNKLALHLCLSVSEVHAGLSRLMMSGLLGVVHHESIPAHAARRQSFIPIKTACEECLIYGVKYFFPVKFGPYTRGIATSYAAPIFKNKIKVGEDPIPVWPYAEGEVRGLALEPLYRSVPKSVIQYPDKLFYELLTLIDAMRGARARERDIAIKLLKERIHDK